MGLPPGEIAPGSVGPAPAADGRPAGRAGQHRRGRWFGQAGRRERPGWHAGAGRHERAGQRDRARQRRGSGRRRGSRARAEDAVRPAGPRAVVPRARPSTGDPRVDDAVARLDDLAGLPIAEHLAVFEYVHERLTEALGDLDVHAPARAGDHSPGARGG